MLSLPLILMFALEGVEGAFYHVYNNVSSDELVPFDRLVIKLPECVIEQYSTDVADYHRAVRPAFDALWNAVGFAKSTFLMKIQVYGRGIGANTRASLFSGGGAFATGTTHTFSAIRAGNTQLPFAAGRPPDRYTESLKSGAIAPTHQSCFKYNF